MGARPFGGGDHRLWIDFFGQAGDVFCNRCFKQRDVLRQIPDVGPQNIVLKLVQRRAIQPDFALRGLPDIRQRTRQR